MGPFLIHHYCRPASSFLPGKVFRGRPCAVETARRAVSTSSRDAEDSPNRLGTRFSPCKFVEAVPRAVFRFGHDNEWEEGPLSRTSKRLRGRGTRKRGL